MYGNEFIVNEAVLDWITLTSYADRSVLWGVFQSSLRGEAHKRKVSNYEGFTDGQGLFFGVRNLSDGAHEMLTASGYRAMELWLEKRDEIKGMRATRMDVQVTEPIVSPFRMRHARDILVESSPDDWRGRKRKCLLYEGEGGLDTLYIGSRASEMCYRLYVKEDFRGARFLRFEVETKGDKSTALHDGFNKGVTSMERFIAWEWGRLPLLFRRYVDHFLWMDDIKVERPPKARAREGNKRYQWFVSSVVPTLERMVRDEQIGDLVKMYLRSILDSGEMEGD